MKKYVIKLAIVFKFLCKRIGCEAQEGAEFRLKDLPIDDMVGDRCFGCCQAHWVYLLDFFWSNIQFYVLLSPYLCFISFHILIYLF